MSGGKLSEETVGIKKRNLDEQHLVLRVAGPASADANLDFGFAEFDYHVKNVYSEVVAAGVTGSTVADVHKNGTTIFSAGGKITYTTGTTPDSYSALTAGMETGNKGDKFSLDVDTAHTTPAEGLLVHIVLTRKEPRGGNTPTNVAPSAL